jgi:predicted PhzF superfamily epimerase YddE/YHI9
LASAHVLWEEGQLDVRKEASFHTRSGTLTASRQDGLIWLNFPVTAAQPVSTPPDLQRGIGVAIRYLGRTAFDYLVELESEDQVRSLVPDMSALSRLPVRGVIVTARSSNGEHDFVSRFFAPAAGVPENPVTGSAHCGLGPFWGARIGRNELVGYQASSRGGLCGCVSMVIGFTLGDMP